MLENGLMARANVAARFIDMQPTLVSLLEGNMKIEHAMRAIVPLTFALSLAACDDVGGPRQTASPAFAAHDPSLHRGASSIVTLAVPNYATLESAGAAATGGALKLEADAAGGIPRFGDSYIGSVAVFGYAWADLGSGKAIVAVIHPTIGRDSNQNPDAWHTHPVQLAGGVGASNFCIVSLGTSQAGIAIEGDEIRVNIAQHQAGLSAGDLDVAAAFIVQPEAGCAATGLGVKILSAVGL